MKYFLYTKKASDHTKLNLHLPRGYTARIWKPEKLEMVPYGMQNMMTLFVTWWLMGKFGLFSCDDFCVCIIYYDKLAVHYSVVLPRFFRVPFIAKNDLQIGPVSTNIDHRKKGLASFAINEIMNTFCSDSRTFWYITRTNNIASIKTCEKADFVKYAECTRKPILGVDLLATFVIESRLLDKKKMD